MEYLKDIILIISQILAVAFFVIAFRFKMKELAKTLEETKAIVTEILKTTVQLDKESAVHNQRLLNIEREVFRKPTPRKG